MPESNPILLVEDNPDDVLLTRMAYKQAGITHRLVIVSDCEQAVRYLQGEGPYGDREQFPIPQFILLDLEVPRMTGFEFLVWLRQEPELKHLPVIALTGSLNPADMEHAYQAGANCFVAKPTGFAELAATLTKVCGFWLKLSKLPETPIPLNLVIRERKLNRPQRPDAEKMAA